MTEIPLIACKASQKAGYLDQKSGPLLCPDESAFETQKEKQLTEDDEEEKEADEKAGEKGRRALQEGEKD